MSFVNVYQWVCGCLYVCVRACVCVCFSFGFVGGMRGLIVVLSLYFSGSGIIKMFMLNSAEHENFPAHKC